jgi:DNA-binding beta-propeller fold protein YncE
MDIKYHSKKKKNLLFFTPYPISITVLFGGVVLLLLVVVGNNIHSIDAFENATDYKFVKKWGGKGTADGQFLRPHDLDFSPDEKILYAVDRDGSRIQAFDKGGNFLFKFGKDGTEAGQMHVPYGIDVDKKGNVWLADRANDRVQEFGSKGKFILKFGTEDGVPSAAEGKFDNPRHVAVSKDLKYVYVADSKNNRISQFDINGTYIKSIGKLGNKSGEFNLPTTVEIDSKGNFFVNERGNERIQKFDSNWNPILMWGSKGSGDNQFCHMEHIALDKYDNVYVTDPQSDPGCSQQPRVLKYNSEGKFITKWGSFGKGDGQFQDPEHLAVDSEGNVYVSDRKRDDIQKFAPAVIDETSNNKNNTILNNSQSQSSLLLPSQKETSKKVDLNVLSAMTPKLANTTKKIDVKAWDKLFGK